MAAIPVVIDACSSLNLFATGRPVEIARAANLHLLVLPEVQAEAKHLLGPPDDEGVRPLDPVDWDALWASGVAKPLSFPDEALADFIEFAAKLTDVDARCAALAKHLNLTLLSDDGKVRKVFSASGGAGLLSTASTIRDAASALSFDKTTIRTLFVGIRERARFEPPRKDPAFAWYQQQMA